MKRVIFSALLLVICLHGYAQKTRIQLNLKVGETYRQVTTLDSDIHQTLMSEQMDIKSIIIAGMSFKVISASKKSYELEVRYDNMGMQMNLPGVMEMNFDTESTDPDDLFSKIMSQLIDKPFQMTMTKAGKVINIKNLDTVFGSMLDAFPELTEEQLAPIKDELMKSFGDNSFKGNFEMFSFIFPKKRVKPGDTWKIKTELAQAFTGTINTTYTFIEKTADYILIKGESTIISNSDQLQNVGTLGASKVDLKGTMSTTIKLDPKSGWTMSATANQKMDGDIFVEQMPGSAQGMEIKMSFVNVISLSEK